MKKIIFACILSLIPVFAFASPFAVTGEFDSGVVTSCVFTLNSGTAVTLPPTASTDPLKSFCKYDLVSAVNGNNVVSVSYKNMWGASTSVPFSFAKVLPPTPSNIHLSE